jgi:hypothetical protein
MEYLWLPSKITLFLSIKLTYSVAFFDCILTLSLYESASGNTFQQQKRPSNVRMLLQRQRVLVFHMLYGPLLSILHHLVQVTLYPISIMVVSRLRCHILTGKV